MVMCRFCASLSYECHSAEESRGCLVRKEIIEASPEYQFHKKMAEYEAKVNDLAKMVEHEVKLSRSECKKLEWSFRILAHLMAGVLGAIAALIVASRML